MSREERKDERVLLVRAGRLTCALPLGGVSETMRPLPLRVLGGVPPYVRGASTIRGRATPVVDLAVLLGGPPLGEPSRYVVLRGSSPVALAVDAVPGIVALPHASLGELPRLLADFGAEHVQSVASLDGELAVVLRATIVVPEDVWQRAGAEFSGGASP